MTLEHKQFAFEVKNLNETGELEGYASVYGVLDQGGDIVVAGAFDKLVKSVQSGGRKPKMLWQHRPDEVIGVWEQVSSDATGLFMKGRLLLDIPRARECHTLLRAKALDGLSIGYRTVDYEMGSNGARYLKELDLRETSVVTFPMNEDATVTDVKNLQSVRDVERILRDAGVPNNFAKLIAAKGFDDAMAEVKGELRDADSEKSVEAALALNEMFIRMKGAFTNAKG
jgi:HK97 family phage prohead protease